MKKIANFIIIILVLLIATPAFAATKSGEYRREGSTEYYNAWVRIEMKDDNTFSFKGEAIWASGKEAAERGAVNTGDISGIAKIEGNKAVYKEGENATLTFYFLNNGQIRLEESPVGAFGGLNVTFNGIYIKQGK